MSNKINRGSTEIAIRYYDDTDTIAMWDEDWKVELSVPYHAMEHVMKLAHKLRIERGIGK